MYDYEFTSAEDRFPGKARRAQRSIETAIKNIHDSHAKKTGYPPYQRDLTPLDMGKRFWELKIPPSSVENADGPTFIKAFRMDRQVDLIIYGIELLANPCRNGRPIFKSLIIDLSQTFPMMNIIKEGCYYFSTPFVESAEGENLHVRIPHISFVLNSFKRATPIRFPIMFKGHIFSPNRFDLALPNTIYEDETKEEKEEDTLLKPVSPFYCQVCQATHPPSAGRYQCLQCARLTCLTCVSSNKKVGMGNQCPHCGGEMVEC